MKLFLLLVFTAILMVSCATVDDRWKTVDEGFRMTIPANWRKQEVHPIDSNAGGYKGRTVDFEFDEVFGLGYSKERIQAAIETLNRKERDKSLLKAGEEIWHVNGRIARFSKELSDPKVSGRRFPNVALLYVPYEGQPASLSIYVSYRGEADLPTIERVLKSLEWKNIPGGTRTDRP